MASFGDNFKRMFSDTAKIAVKKSEEVIETAKNKYSEYDIKGDIDELYKNIGKVVYTAFNEDTDVSEVIKELCSKVDEKLAELDAVKKK